MAHTASTGRATPDVVPASELGDHSYVAHLRGDDVDAFHDRALKAGAEVVKTPRFNPQGQREKLPATEQLLDAGPVVAIEVGVIRHDSSVGIEGVHAAP